MCDENLASYLQDHLAGAVGGLEMVQHLIDMARDPVLREFLLSLKAEIEADERTLQEILQQAGVEKSPVRQAAAWLTEKVCRAKFKLAGSQPDGLGMLEAMEGLTLGITGKRALWQALPLTKLRGDFERLQQRAEDQLARLERHRLAVARAALAGI